MLPNKLWIWNKKKNDAEKQIKILEERIAIYPPENYYNNEKCLFLSSWYPSRVHTTLGNFKRYHALAASKYNTINVLYIVADDNVKDYEIKYFQDEELGKQLLFILKRFLSI